MNDNNNLISVVDLANKLKVSKQSVFYNANKLHLQLKKIEGVSYATEQQATKITARINSNKRNKSKSSSNNQSNVNHAETQSDSVKQAVNDDLINELREQLKVKDIQIERLNNHLDQQQVLSLNDKSRIEQLETELNEVRLLLNSKSDLSDVKHFNADLVNDKKVKNDVPNIKKDDSMIKNLLTIFRFVLKK